MRYTNFISTNLGLGKLVARIKITAGIHSNLIYCCCGIEAESHKQIYMYIVPIPIAIAIKSLLPWEFVGWSSVFSTMSKIFYFFFQISLRILFTFAYFHAD